MSEQGQAALPLGTDKGEAKPIPLDRQISCAERELAMRESAYPRWVKEGRMSEAAANEEIAAMAGILATLRLFKRFEGPLRSTLRAWLDREKKQS